MQLPVSSMLLLYVFYLTMIAAVIAFILDSQGVGLETLKSGLPPHAQAIPLKADSDKKDLSYCFSLPQKERSSEVLSRCLGMRI